MELAKAIACLLGGWATHRLGGSTRFVLRHHLFRSCGYGPKINHPQNFKMGCCLVPNNCGHRRLIENRMIGKTPMHLLIIMLDGCSDTSKISCSWLYLYIQAISWLLRIQFQLDYPPPYQHIPSNTYLHYNPIDNGSKPWESPFARIQIAGNSGCSDQKKRYHRELNPSKLFHWKKTARDPKQCGGCEDNGWWWCWWWWWWCWCCGR